MTFRATARWIRTFLNASRQASFHDKIKVVQSEQNPYYLLEWLIIERAENDEAFWEEWSGERTPGLEKGSRVEVEAWFREQLLFGLMLGEPLSGARSALWAAAFADLEKQWGVERWETGGNLFRRKAEQSVERFGAYSKQLEAEMAKQEAEHRAEQAELEAETDECEEERDLESELRKAKAKWDRRRQELPGKLLRKMYPEDALLRYMAVSGIPDPALRVVAAVQFGTERWRGHHALQWKEAVDAGDPEQSDFAGPDARHLAHEWVVWLAAYMNRSDMVRGWTPWEERQRHSLRFGYRQWRRQSGQRPSPDGFGLWMEGAFRAQGWEERLAEPEFSEELLHGIVWNSLSIADRRRRLREEVVLKHWNVFAPRFFRTDETALEVVSWLFVLEPEDVQQRLLRGGAELLRTDDVVSRLCHIFAEGIRTGLDRRLVASFYTYLAKHDKDALHSFVHGTKSMEEAAVFMELPALVLSQLFRGDGVRQSSARKHLLRLFYDWIDRRTDGRSEPKRVREQSETAGKMAGILAFDKRAAVVGWMQRHERDWRSTIGSDPERTFARLLRFRWIGTKGNADEQHRSVQEWLHRHSDWVQFETDAPNVLQSGVTYKVVRPGAIDAETGELLLRVIVRAEWSDRGEADRLLNELKLL